MTTKEAKAARSRDPLGYRLKVGVLTPSTNTIVQPEYDDMRPTGVTNHVARIHIPEKRIDGDDGFSDLVTSIDSAIEAAAERVATADPDCIALGVSIEAIWKGGVDAARQLVVRLREHADVPVYHAADAIVAALDAHGLSGGTIGIITPYMPVADAHIREFFGQIGFDVVAAEHLRRTSPLDIAYTTPKELRDAMLLVDGAKPDAIVQFGANLCVGRLAGEAETWLGRPVIAVNTATYWHTLRSSGILDRVTGFGSLLENH